MAAPILPVSSIALPETVRPAGAPRGGGFGDVFASAVNAVEGANHTASETVQQFLAGEGAELHTAILATQRAELSFELFLQARNKVVSAYQEIMRMQI